ncbi:MAG: hypothetical protein AB1671_04370 [Thermodesulfobacteriota bacterium]|jgi:hypothetical protein
MIIRLLSGYTASVLVLLVLVSAVTGVERTFLGFGVIFATSTLGILALWWWDERHWSAAASPALPPHAGTSLLAPESLAGEQPGPRPASPPLPLAGKNLSSRALEEKSLDALAPRAAALADRLMAVYPLIQREDLYKIIWMTMVELCHEQHLSEDQYDSFVHTSQPTDEKKAAG